MRKQWLSRKKIQAVFLMLCLGCLVFGCGQQTQGVEESSDRLRIVCTIFPEYDWVKQILGEQAEEAELTLLMKNGADLHSYQPTVADIVHIANCDLFLYIGGESDQWVADALTHAEKPGRTALCLMDTLEGRLHLEDEIGDTHEAHDHHEESYDEHIWLSLQNAALCCKSISQRLEDLDGTHRESYRRNAEAYCEKLLALDEKLQALTADSPVQALLFADRFPFRYLIEDYNLTYFAAFPGCSAETEASFHTIVELAEALQGENLPAVLVLEGGDGALARTILETADMDCPVLQLDSMQTITRQEASKGVGYLSIMEENVSVLQQALGKGI